MITTRHYYADDRNEPAGPFTPDELKGLREQGLIADDTLICVEDGSEWIPLSTLLRSAVPPSAGPPPFPSPPPTAQPLPGRQAGERRSSYQRTAETIGMVPDLSGKRNLLQLAITIPVTLAFAFYGFLGGGLPFALSWGFGGLLVAVLASGAVLMVLGWRKG